MGVAIPNVFNLYYHLFLIDVQAPFELLAIFVANIFSFISFAIFIYRRNIKGIAIIALFKGCVDFAGLFVNNYVLYSPVYYTSLDLFELYAIIIVFIVSIKFYKKGIWKGFNKIFILIIVYNLLGLISVIEEIVYPEYFIEFGWIFLIGDISVINFYFFIIYWLLNSDCEPPKRDVPVFVTKLVDLLKILMVKGFEIYTIIKIKYNEDNTDKIQVKPLPLAIFPTVVMLTICVGKLIYLALYYRDALNVPFVVKEFLGIAIFVGYLIGLLLRNKKIVVSVVFTEVIIVIVGVTLRVIDGESGLILNVLRIAPYIIVAIIGLMFYDRRVKVPFLIAVPIMTVAYIFSILSDVNEKSVLMYGSIYTTSCLYYIVLLYVLISYWLLNPYKYVYESEVKTYTVRKKIGMSLGTVIASGLAVFIAINVYMEQFRYSDEEMDVIQKLSEINNEEVKYMLQDFRFDGQPIDFPYKVSKLPSEFKVDIGYPTYALLYDVDCMLMYNGEYLAYALKTPDYKGESYIFSLGLDDDFVNAKKFTLSGIGIGSTEEELEKVFPNYTKKSEGKQESYGFKRLYIYGDLANANDDAITIYTIDGVVSDINIMNGELGISGYRRGKYDR